MKINLYRENFRTESFDIKKLSMFDEAELLVLSDELRKFWKQEEKDGNIFYQIDIEKVKKSIDSEELKEIINRSVELLNNVFDDTERMSKFNELSFDDLFFVIPTLSNEIFTYLQKLKKK